MSHDLMVFEVTAAPEGHALFLEWYCAETECDEAKRYDDPALSTTALQAWLSDIFAIYPPMNGHRLPLRSLRMKLYSRTTASASR